MVWETFNRQSVFKLQDRSISFHKSGQMGHAGCSLRTDYRPETCVPECHAQNEA